MIPLLAIHVSSNNQWVVAIRRSLLEAFAKVNVVLEVTLMSEAYYQPDASGDQSGCCSKTPVSEKIKTA